MKEKVLNIVLRKEYALDIVKGKKVREYRSFTNFWIKRLCLFEDPNDPYLATGLKEYHKACKSTPISKGAFFAKM